MMTRNRLSVLAAATAAILMAVTAPVGERAGCPPPDEYPREKAVSTSGQVRGTYRATVG